MPTPAPMHLPPQIASRSCRMQLRGISRPARFPRPHVFRRAQAQVHDVVRRAWTATRNTNAPLFRTACGVAGVQLGSVTLSAHIVVSNSLHPRNGRSHTWCMSNATAYNWWFGGNRSDCSRVNSSSLPTASGIRTESEVGCLEIRKDRIISSRLGEPEKTEAKE
ncbi:hypothetical protein DFP72DRAFT_15292 [Ephemerocybe angulata]|uniref:Uncharacterized protein n=1 Tax=Ephemerocybe angulata TaxID=980116 RepID=A0A8H6IIT5_9AGAR|nr:hypothetical protein DFP72DRAFT_15292 [Tulosesus angulatus]